MNCKSTGMMGAALLVIAAAAVLALATVPVADDSEAYTTTIYDNWCDYEITGPGEVQLTHVGGTQREVTIPEKVTSGSDEYTVTAIAPEACQDNGIIYRITVPATVKTIGDCAFKNCSRLDTVVLTDGLQSIGYQAFYGCKYIYSLDLNIATLTSIGDQAFWGCKSIKALTLPAGLTSMGIGVFDNCKKLTDVDASACTNFANVIAEEKHIGLMNAGATTLYAMWSAGPKEVTIPSTVTDYRCTMAGVDYQKVTFTGHGTGVSIGFDSGVVSMVNAENGKEYTIVLKRTTDIPEPVKSTAGAYDVFLFQPTVGGEIKAGDYQIALESSNKYYTPYLISPSGEKTALPFDYDGQFYMISADGEVYVSLMAENNSLIPNAQDFGIALIIIGTILAAIVAVVNHRRYGA